MEGRRKIRILYIITTLAVGGAQGQFVNLVTRLDKERFDVMVCCLTSDGPRREPLDAAGIPVVTIGFRGFGDLFRDPSSVFGPLFKLARIIRSFHPDIVHGFLFWAYVLGTLAAKFAGTPIVVTSRRSLGIYKAAKFKFLLLERIANLLTDIVVGNSEAVRQDTLIQERLPAQKMVVIYNGIESDRYRIPSNDLLSRSLELEQRGPVVAVIATLSQRKGHAYFFQSWSSVTRIHRGAMALLIGDGPARAELETMAGSMDLGGSVKFLGTRHDVPELLSIVDLVVHPSLEEGFSNAILEAMAAGKPVVAASVGGNPEAVVDGSTGFLVPERDSDAMTEAILWLIDHPAEAAALGYAARRRAESCFDMGVMVHQYEQIYEYLISKKKVELCDAAKSRVVDKGKSREGQDG